MISSKTDAAPPCGPVLRKVLEGAALQQVAGNTPFLLDQPDVCWWLEAGSIELFVLEAREGQAHGIRQHFTSIEPGTLLFGMPEDDDAGPDAGATLLAVPHVNTLVRRLDLNSLRTLGSDAASDLVGPVNRWIMAVSAGLAQYAAPSPVIHLAAQAGSALAVQANQRVAAAQGVVWLEFPRDTSLFLDAQDLPPGAGTCLFPLSPDSWMQNGTALELTGLDTAHLLWDGRLWAGLEVLHGLLLPAARMSLMLARVDEYNRLRQRLDSADRDWRGGLDSLGGVLDGKRAPMFAADDGDPPLVQALRAVGHAEGFEIRLPARRSLGAADLQADLAAILQASGLRSRPVVLERGWEQHDTQAMLGFAKENGRPLAILPRAGGSVQVADPGARQTFEGRQAVDMLADNACVITAPLPFSALGWKSLPVFTLRRGWRDLLAVLLAAMCGGLLGMAVPIASSYLIDTVIPGHDRNHLVQVGLILVVLGLATFVMSYVGGLAFSRFQGRASPALQAALIDRLLRLPVGFFRDYSAGDLALRASAVTQIDQMVSGRATQMLLGGLFAIFSFALMMYYDWRLGLWAVLLTLLYTVLTLIFIGLQLRQERNLARLDGQLQSLVLQLVMGIVKIRLSASEDRAFARWATPFSQFSQLGVIAARYTNLQALLNAVFSLLPLAVFFLVLGYFRDPHEINVFAVGGLAAFLTAFNNFRGGVTQMTETVVTLLAVRPLLERAMPILAATPEFSDDKDDPGVLSGTVEFSGVSFRYAADGPQVLNDVSLSARAGEFVAIVGASGCGKSTLMRMLLGFETPESGRILLDGKDMGEIDVLAVRRQMGVVLQSSRPMAGSIYENIVGASHHGLADAWDAARKAGLAEDIERMPMGMHTVVTEGGSLSCGQMQRLMIARTIVGNPRILVLDEATSALDNRIQAMITESLERLSITRIVVAHRLSTVVKANRIYVMDAGRIVEQGSFEQLMRMSGAFSRLAAAQLV